MFFISPQAAIVGVVIVIALVLALRSSGKRFWVFSLVPTAWFLLFYGFVLRAYLTLGYWPSPYHPDPKDLAFDFHHVAIWFSFPVVVASAVVLALLVAYYARSYMGSARHRLGMLYFAATFAAWLLAVRFDPGRFIEWFVD